MKRLETWQEREMSEIIQRLVEAEQPATLEEAEELSRDWNACGYEAVVRAWAYMHRKIRQGEAA